MATPTLQSARPDDATLKVFIVEDSELIRERLGEIVHSIAGARCAGSAATADAAVRGILASRPNAVVLDISLSQGNGFDVLRALEPVPSDMPVYVLSNMASEPYRRAAIRLGAAAFLDKTTQFDRMRELLVQRASQLATSVQ